MDEKKTAQQIADRFLTREVKRTKTAGEVRFIKDRGGDKNEWGWGTPGPIEREIGSDFKFNAKNLKPLAKTLRATLASMGHALSAYDTFTRLKSAVISPDGALGGKGYIQKIADMRRQYMNSIEALSSLADTLYDEMHAAHWDPAQQEQSPREREQVKNIMQDVEEIKDDPAEWAEEEEEDMDEGAEEAPADKKSRKQASRVAERYLERTK